MPSRDRACFAHLSEIRRYAAPDEGGDYVLCAREAQKTKFCPNKIGDNFAFCIIA